MGHHGSALLGRLYYALVLVLILPFTLSACNFPDYLQSDANNRDWRGQIRSQYTEFTLTITVNNNMMNVLSTDSSATSYTRTCLQTLPGNKFITTHEQSRQRTQSYVCVQLIQRTNSVIQVRESEIVSSMTGVCDMDLHLDPWIWVDRNSVLLTSQPCQLTGGYSVKLFDKEYNMGLCDAYQDHVWMESECVAGIGLYFNFRHGRCIPNILMSSQQRTICLANWTEASYTFMLIRHDTQPYMWVMRYPADQRHLSSFVAYLMKDLYASIEDHVTEIDAYVQMDMVRDIVYPVSSLCIDEFEGCDYYADPCNKGGETALTCARTCGVCNQTRPVVCNFEDVWQGDWIDAIHSNNVGATFMPSILYVYHNNLQQKFYCIHWDNPHFGPTIKHTTYIMLVTEFNNGCRPQYSCAKIVHRYASAVMFLQLSSERHWPFTNTITDPVNCDNFDFGGDTNTLMPNQYRSKHHKLLYSKLLDTGVTCNMPLGVATNYTVTLSDSTQCSGRLRTSTSGSSVSVNISECDTYSSIVYEIPREHTCVESSRLFSSALLVVSRTDVEPYQFYCWLFSRRSRDVFYLVESAHCNDNTKRRISRGHLQPLAAFSSVPPTLISPAVPFTLRTLAENTPAGEHSISDVTQSVVHKNNTSIPATTQSPINPASYVSPIVISAAVIIFILFKLPCMCKHS